jgi:hypothetical protein
MDQVHLEQIARLSAKVAKLERTVEFLLEKLNLQYVDETTAPISRGGKMAENR